MWCTRAGRSDGLVTRQDSGLRMATGSVASPPEAAPVVGRLGQGGGMRRGRMAGPVAERSAFAGFRFPPDVITLAVPVVPPVRPVLPGPRGAAGRARRRGRPRHRLPVGAAVHTATSRGRPAVPPPGWGPLVRGRDLREGRWTVALPLPLPRDRPVRTGHRRARVPAERRQSSPPVLRAGHRHDEGGTR